MFKQTGNHLKRTGCHIRTGLGALDQVHGMADGSRKHFGFKTISTINIYYLSDQFHAVERNIIQAANERRHIRSTGFGGKECLAGREQGYNSF